MEREYVHLSTEHLAAYVARLPGWNSVVEGPVAEIATT